MELPKIVEKLRPLLSQPIPLSSGSLRHHLQTLESLRYALAEARVDSLQSLQEKRRQALWPKDREFTELDRKTRLEGDVAVYEKNYQFLLQLEEIVRDRLELGKLLIK